MTATLLNRPIPFDLRLRALVFLAVTAIVYVAATTIVGILDSFGTDAAHIAWGVTLDLAFVVPAAYWLLIVRGGGPRITIVPVTLLSLAAAGAIVPVAHHQALNVLEIIAMPIEIGLVVFLIWHVHRSVRLEAASNGPRVDIVDRFQSLSSRMLGPGKVAEILAFEASVFYYAVGSWRLQAPVMAAGETRLTHDRKVLYPALFVGVMIAGIVELVGVHFLLMRWSHLAAWILTAISAYGLIWFIGDYRAIQLRPSILRKDGIELRIGLRWTLEIPMGTIRGWRKLAAKERHELSQDKSVLRAVLLGEPGYLLELSEEIEAVGAYGLRRRSDRIAVAIDDGPAFEAALMECLPPSPAP